jgi:hypothetical protein
MITETNVSHRQLGLLWQPPLQQTQRARRTDRLRQQLSHTAPDRLPAVRHQSLGHDTVRRNRHHMHHPLSQPDHTRQEPHPHHRRHLLAVNHYAAPATRTDHVAVAPSNRTGKTSIFTPISQGPAFLVYSGMHGHDRTATGR